MSVHIVGASVEARAMENLLQSQPGISVVTGSAQIVLILGPDGLAALQRRRLRTPRRAREVFVLLTNGRQIDFRLARELPIRGLIGADEPMAIFLQGLRDVAEGKSFCSPQMVPVLISATSGSGPERDPSQTGHARSATAKHAPSASGIPSSAEASQHISHHSPHPKSVVDVPHPGAETDYAAAIRRGARLGLSSREAEIAAATGAGLSNLQIAEEFHVSLSTVKFHLYRIYQKLGIHNRAQLTKLTAGAGQLATV